MTIRPKSFFAYPSAPEELRQTIELGHQRAQLAERGTIWPQLDIFGASIPDEIRNAIDSSDIAFFDVTVRNPNVYYELGYTVGKGKAVGPVINSSFEGAQHRIQREGIFDNLGYKGYYNAKQLAEILRTKPNQVLIQLYTKELNFRQPLFLLDTPIKTDFRNTIVSAVKKSGIFYRSFDPEETPRLSTVQLIGQVTSSAGVILPLLETYIVDHALHNLRAAFVAGLAHGLGRPTLLVKLRTEDITTPADFRDDISYVQSPDDIEQLVSEFGQAAVLNAQSIDPQDLHSSSAALTSISLGSVAAENEFRTLGQYFLETSEFTRTLRGDVKVVTGRKGSGKTAIFFQARDTLRRDSNNVVIDLKPESYQLQEFRDELSEIEQAVAAHTMTAFWQFVILSEIVVHLRRKAQSKARYDIDALAIVERANRLLDQYDLVEASDFTSRLNRLGRYFVAEMRAESDLNPAKAVEKLTNIIFKSAIPEIREFVISNTLLDQDIILFFDNIDKGWPSTGVEPLDLKIVSHLLEGLVKIGQDLSAKGRNFQSTVFLRNDIFELLLDQTPDRGKSGRVNIDWTDPDKLKQVILKRLQASLGGEGLGFEQLWYSRFPEKVSDKDSFDFFIDHSLMRPRFLLTIIELAIGHAVNRGHSTVQASDCKEAVKQHAFSLLDDFGYEIRDVSGIDEGILYGLVGCPQTVASTTLVAHLQNFGITPEQAEDAFQLMLWYGLLGIIGRNQRPLYIYDVEYKMKRLQAEMRQPEYTGDVCIHPALYIALM